MTAHSTSLSILTKGNKIEGQPREIHIWEFPEEFYVKLEPNVTKELIYRSAEQVGGIWKLGQVLQKGSKVYNYREGKSFIPIATLRKLCDLAGDEFTLEQMEPHIAAYKGGYSANPIQNPHLPLRETPKLFALLGHLTGDGGHCGNHLSYTNTRKTLIWKFIDLLRTVFGGIPFYVYVVKRAEPIHDFFQVKFGITVGHLLRYLYGVDIGTFTARVPSRLFDLARVFAAAYLRALADDDGCVQDGGIWLVSANQELLQGIYHLVQAKFPELGEYVVFEEKKQKPPRRTQYHVRFRTGAFELYRTFIGFSHPEKQQDLDRILARRARGWAHRTYGSTRRMLLEWLTSGPMTMKTLAQRLEITRTGIHYCLKDLFALEFVRVKKAETGPNGAKLLEITGRGQNFLQLPAIGLLGSGCVGRTKVKILKTLARRNLTSKKLRQKLDLKKATIHKHLAGRRKRGKWNPGLLELGLVKRSGDGGSTDPYVYSLTEAGKRFVVELETHFPALCNSA